MKRFLPTPQPLLFALAVAAALAVCAPARADRPWESVRTTSDGLHLSRRPGRTSGFYTLRLELRSPLPPARLADSLWKSFFVARPPVQQRRFILRAAEEVVFYDQMKVSVVSDRDYTMRIRRTSDDGAERIVFQTAPELGPPPDPDFVRIPIVEGAWEFRPDGTGTQITYTVYSEPGGSVPAFMVRGAQVDEALENVRFLLKD